ncbi:HAD-IIA family hydrolase [Corynebacterium sp. sy039]|uniref:HAD-IIA family hydrolase n=1 Tax=Corynebacterium sp. sy039 TaxID=2599641 RepID=UPI0011B76E97|nr:HAD-IIA family hydrolase [Corynebacterium sp. sy039]QDZ42554.1 HAD-IIA family hydrolase [Corynebacterium sp. sy039]
MSLCTHYDAMLFDLDGTVWEGTTALPHAVSVLNALDAHIFYITNNASRSAQEVTKLLNECGIMTRTDQVLTAAQAAVNLATQHLQAGDTVLVLGADSFRDLVHEAGYRVVDSADDNPKAVVQGHSPETGWKELSEAALAIRRGAKYFVSNLDASLPSPRGLMVGNGSMVAAVVSATGQQPISAGKPEPTLFHQAAQKCAARRPLVIGDRLDTDIAGGVAAHMDTLHVLTGVSQSYELIHAKSSQRPTYIAQDLRALHEDRDRLTPQEQGGFIVRRDARDIILSGGSEQSHSIEALRSVVAYAWEDEQFEGNIIAESPRAQQILEEWA